MRLRHDMVLVAPATCHRIERALEELAAKARRDGAQLPADVAEFIADVRLSAESYRRALVSDDSDAEVRPSSEAEVASRMLNTGTVGEQLGISGHAVADLLRRGRLPGRKHAGSWWIDPADLEALVRDRQGAATE